MRWIAAAAALLLASCGAESARKPDLYLITSLPLMFGEGFGLDGAKSDAITGLEKAVTVKPIDLPSQLPERAILLMVQPRALPAEQLVALDSWVRRGGGLVLLADPLLEWPSQRPLGDRLRPPTSYADTGLLQHWGLRLDAPEQRGPVSRGGGHSPLVYVSPGRLVKTGPGCALSRAGIVAECRIGRGRIAVVSDADWLNLALVKAAGGRFEDHQAELIELVESVRATS